MTGKIEPQLLASENPLVKFEQFLRIRNKTEDTIARYLDVAQQFIQVLGEKDRYDAGDVEYFLSWLREKPKKRYATEAHPTAGGTYLRFNYYALKTFYRSLRLEWELEKEAVPKLDTPFRPHYTIEEINKLLAAIRKAHAEGKGKMSVRGMRDWLFFRIIGLTFSRRKGPVLLKRWDYDHKSGVIKMPSIKHGREKVVELDAETKEVMNRYLLHRTDIYPALFPSWRSTTDSGTLSLQSINKLLKQYAKLAGVPYKGVHAWRRGMVTYLYEQGLREREIFEMGDWKDEDMVREYVQLSPKFAEEKRKEMHPFFRK